MRRAGLAVALLGATLPLAVGVATAGEGAGPPAGWEEPPPLALPAPRASGSARPAACCRFDATCCFKQSANDAARPEAAQKIYPIKVSELPEARRQAAEAGGPPIAGVPPLRYLDDTGQPPPWPGGPKNAIRLMPPARFGEIHWQDERSPFFLDPANRGMGYGELHTIRGKDAIAALASLVGKVSYTAFNEGEGGRVLVDLVEGQLAGSLDLRASAWTHADAAPVAEGHAHAFRGFYEGDERVVIVLPEVVLGGESGGVKLRGGFFPSRFSRSEAFTLYALPLTPGTAALALFSMSDSQFLRWFPRPAGLGKPADRTGMVVSSSRTSAEPEAHVSLLVFPGRRF